MVVGGGGGWRTFLIFVLFWSLGTNLFDMGIYTSIHDSASEILGVFFSPSCTFSFILFLPPPCMVLTIWIRRSGPSSRHPEQVHPLHRGGGGAVGKEIWETHDNDDMMRPDLVYGMT